LLSSCDIPFGTWSFFVDEYGELVVGKFALKFILGRFGPNLFANALSFLSCVLGAIELQLFHRSLENLGPVVLVECDVFQWDSKVPFHLYLKF